MADTPAKTEHAMMASGSSPEEIDLFQVISILWRYKWLVIALGVLGGIIGIAFALSLPNIYKAEVVVSPVEQPETAGLSGLSGQLGGLAGLAGVSLPAPQVSQVDAAIETIQSRKFAERVITGYDMLVPLMAARSWSPTSGELTYDETLYDASSKKWVRDVEPPKKVVPSSWESYDTYKDIVSVKQDSTNGIVRISVEHVSPVLAQKWADAIVDEINTVMRQKDVAEAELSIGYLEEQLDKTTLANMRSVFYQLIVEQTKKKMLADVRDEYVFATIDPAVVPEEKFKPRRATIVIIAGVLGGMLGILLSFILYLRSSRLRD